MAETTSADARDLAPTVKLTLELSQRVADLLTVLTTGRYAPDDLPGVIMKLIDHAQQGVYRPMANERDWLERVFGDEWQAALEPDTDRTAADGRIVFDRPIKPCPNDPPCEHPLSVHVGDDGDGDGPRYCLDCNCGDEPEDDEDGDDGE